jgi:hypothetical protein
MLCLKCLAFSVLFFGGGGPATSAPLNRPTSWGPLMLAGYGHDSKFTNQFIEGLPASKCVSAVAARCPPAEEPIIRMRFGSRFHFSAFARTHRMALCASYRHHQISIGAGNLRSSYSTVPFARWEINSAKGRIFVLMLARSSASR